MDNPTENQSLFIALKQAASFLFAFVCGMLYVATLILVAIGFCIIAVVKSQYKSIGAIVVISIPVLWLFHDAFKPEITLFSNDGPLGGLKWMEHGCTEKGNIIEGVIRLLPLCFVGVWFLWSLQPVDNTPDPSCDPNKIEWKPIALATIGWAIFGPYLYHTINSL